MKIKITNLFFVILLALMLATILFSCNEVSNSLSPYVGFPAMSNINIEAGSYKPKVTWTGGYVTVFGVNRGTKAALDTSLVWLVYANNDNIHYPVSFGTLPSGAQDITSKYGGKTTDSLSEDVTYTFWVMKEKVWNQISNITDKIFSIDSMNNSVPFIVSKDSVSISSMNYFETTLPINLYINISEVNSFGQLAKLSVVETNTNNNPILAWKIIESGVPDSMISAVGIVEGQEYQATNTVWEVWSVQDSAGNPIFGKNDLINSPVYLGQNFAGTQVFTQYPVNGLERGHYYYVWIADKTWDGLTRLRFAKGYAYATFKVY